MTRLFSPPQILIVRTTIDGSPLTLTSNGRQRQVTHIAHTWMQHRLSSTGLEASQDRLYYRVVLDRIVPWEIYQDLTTNLWYLERIIG